MTTTRWLQRLENYSRARQSLVEAVETKLLTPMMKSLLIRFAS